MYAQQIQKYPAT